MGTAGVRWSLGGGKSLNGAWERVHTLMVRADGPRRARSRGGTPIRHAAGNLASISS